MFPEQIHRSNCIERDNGSPPFLFEIYKQSVESLKFFNLGCGGVLLTAPQMKFIGISTSPSFSQPLHHAICDKWSCSPEQIILLPETSCVSCICISSSRWMPLLK